MKTSPNIDNTSNLIPVDYADIFTSTWLDNKLWKHMFQENNLDFSFVLIRDLIIESLKELLVEFNFYTWTRDSISFNTYNDFVYNIFNKITSKYDIKFINSPKDITEKCKADLIVNMKKISEEISLIIATKLVSDLFKKWVKLDKKELAQVLKARLTWYYVLEFTKKDSILYKSLSSFRTRAFKILKA